MMKNQMTPVLMLAASLAMTLPSAKGDVQPNLFPTVPESKWVGQRFIILPQSKALQHYGYQELYRDTDKEYTPLPYQEFAGKIVRVVDIGQGHGLNGEKLDEADLQLEGVKETLHGDIDQGCMEDVAPASDLEAARKLYLGKTLWLSSDHLTTYDPEKDTSDLPTSSAWREAFQKIHVKQYSPVKVIDVVPGWYASLPVRFVVQAAESGVQGYADVHMSDTNVPKSLQAAGRFENTFLTVDPRTRYPWSPKIWTAIENREAILGMTAQQVRMSWGEPGEISKTGQDGGEQWTYRAAPVLTFKSGFLTNVSGLPAAEK